MRWHIEAPVVAVLLGLAGAACEVPTREVVWVTVPSGASVEVVADSLVARGVIHSAGRFVRFARVNRRHLGIQPGTYPLYLHRPMGEVLARLRRGTPEVVRVEVPPGLTLAELSGLLARRLGLDPEALTVAAADPARRAELGASGPTLQGYLYPTTYRFPVEAGAAEVIGMMADTFAGRWRPEWNRRLASLGLSRDQAVVLASIVEGEGPHADDWRRVAAVYHNRLARGMRLQADPTVVYALGERRRLTFRDYAVRSPYNTYRIPALPPGPINSPSGTALEAVLHPAATDHLYLVARPDGRHVFSVTYPEHVTATRTIRETSDF